MDPVSNKIIIFFNFLNINFLPILATFNNSVIPVIFPPALKMLHDKIIDFMYLFCKFFLTQKRSHQLTSKKVNKQNL